MEIGSIFEIDIKEYLNESKNEFFLPFMKNNKFNNLVLFNTGRSAIEYLFKGLAQKKDNKVVLVPSFICNSVTDAILRAGFSIEYYKIGCDLIIDYDDLYDKLNKNIKYVFIVHYFGKKSEESLVELVYRMKKRDVKIIEDISHALYTSDETRFGYGDYVIGSIRKWLPVPDGGFLACGNELPVIELEAGENVYSQNYLAAQIMKYEYLFGTNSVRNENQKSKYLRLNSRAMESLFNDYSLRRITDFSRIYLESYDMEYVINKRIENFDYLFEKVSGINDVQILFDRETGEVPFGLVLLVNNRDDLLQFMIDKNIYCNVHWRISKENAAVDPYIKNISDRIMTIPCDQRYGTVEMDYIYGVIKQFYAMVKD